MTEPPSLPRNRQNTSIDIMTRHAKYVASIMAAFFHQPDTPQFYAACNDIIARTIGAAIGAGKLSRGASVVRGEPLPNQIRTFEQKARWLASAAAVSLSLDPTSPDHAIFMDQVVKTALASAIADGRFKAPSL